MSRAASARYDVPCLMCGAAPGEACRTKRTRRVTDTHQDRIFWQHEFAMGRVSLAYLVGRALAAGAPPISDAQALEAARILASNPGDNR